MRRQYTEECVVCSSRRETPDNHNDDTHIVLYENLHTVHMNNVIHTLKHTTYQQKKAIITSVNTPNKEATLNMARPSK